jgi:hypothetical protein
MGIFVIVATTISDSFWIIINKYWQFNNQLGTIAKGANQKTTISESFWIIINK